MQQQLRLTPKPSKILFLFFSLLHILVLIVIGLLTIAWPIKIGLSILCVISAYYLCWRVTFMRAKNAIIACYLVDESWFVENRAGKSFEADLLGETFASIIVIVLNFKIQKTGKRRSLILMPDSLHKDVFRRLKVYLFAA
ncbi:MAG: protein YgfX [Pseudomonadota bacterium]